jgi:DNA-binding MarR family transcriptional regulator
MSAPTVDVDEASVELAFALKRLRARLRAEARPSEGWTISQLAALGRIVREGPTTASQLAQAEHVRPQSMGEIVAALKAADLVSAEPDPGDGRKLLLRATNAGRQLVKQRSKSREEWLATAIESLVGQRRADALLDTIVLLNALADWDIDEPSTPGRRR